MTFRIVFSVIDEQTGEVVMPEQDLGFQRPTTIPEAHKVSRSIADTLTAHVEASVREHCGLVGYVQRANAWRASLDARLRADHAGIRERAELVDWLRDQAARFDRALEAGSQPRTAEGRRVLNEAANSNAGQGEGRWTRMNWSLPVRCVDVINADQET